MRAAGHAREEHREAEIDDDVGVLADAPRPERAERRREEEARQEQDEVRRERDAEELEEVGMHADPLRTPSAAVRLGATRRLGRAARARRGDGRGLGAAGASTARGPRPASGAPRRSIRGRLARLRRRHVRRAQHRRGPRLLVNMSTAMSPTPTQIAMSATLNVGQWCSCRRSDVEVDEVDDVAVADAVEHVAERAAEHERQTPLERALARLQAAVERHDERDRRDRHEQEERPAHVLARRLEQTPRAAAVLARG